MDNKIRDKTIQDLLFLFQDKINQCIDTIESQNIKIEELIKNGLNDTIKEQIQQGLNDTIEKQVNFVVKSDNFITDGGSF